MEFARDALPFLVLQLQEASGEVTQRTLAARPFDGVANGSPEGHLVRGILEKVVLGAMSHRACRHLLVVQRGEDDDGDVR